MGHILTIFYLERDTIFCLWFCYLSLMGKFSYKSINYLVLFSALPIAETNQEFTSSLVQWGYMISGIYSSHVHWGTWYQVFMFTCTMGDSWLNSTLEKKNIFWKFHFLGSFMLNLNWIKWFSNPNSVTKF